MKVFLIFLTIFIFYHQAEGLQCFYCTVQNSESDQTCATDPAKVPGSIKKCDKKYCTSVRQEFKDPPGRINSFYRGCEDNPAKMNTEIEDNDYIYYYRACTEDICNGGIGKDSPSGSNNLDEDGEGIIRIPGSNNANAIMKNILLLFVSFLLIKF